METNSNENDELIDSLTAELEIIYNEQQRLEEEFKKESDKHNKLIAKAKKLKEKSDQLSKKSEKLVNKINFSNTSKTASIILSLVFITLWAITNFNPIMLISTLSTAFGAIALNKYSKAKGEELIALNPDADMILQLADMYQQEEYDILEKQKKLQEKINANFEKFFTINDKIDELEGVNSFELLNQDLEQEIEDLRNNNPNNFDVDD